MSHPDAQGFPVLHPVDLFLNLTLCFFVPNLNQRNVELVRHDKTHGQRTFVHRNHTLKAPVVRQGRLLFDIYSITCQLADRYIDR